MQRHQGGPPKSAPKGKSIGNCEDEATETSQNVPLGTIDLGSFEVLCDHGDVVDDDESTYETTEMIPLKPFWLKQSQMVACPLVVNGVELVSSQF